MNTEDNNQEDVSVPTEDTGEVAPAPENDTQVIELDTLKKQIEEANATIGSLKRELKDAKKPKDTPQQTKPQDDLDYGMKAYLRSEGIEPTEFDFVKEHMQESGMDLDRLVKNNYFQSQLKELRDKRATEAAIPSKTRGTGESSKSKVDYWVNRGEMPENTPENFELRAAIVNRRIEIEKNRNQFSSNPILMA